MEVYRFLFNNMFLNGVKTIIYTCAFIEVIKDTPVMTVTGNSVSANIFIVDVLLLHAH